MITATQPDQYFHVTGIAAQTVQDGTVPILIAFDSFSLFILKIEVLKELNDITFVKFIQDVVDSKDLIGRSKQSTFVIDTEPGSEEELLKLINRKIKLLCDADWNEAQLKKIMPAFQEFLNKIK